MPEPNLNINQKSTTDGRYIPRWQVRNRVLFHLDNQDKVYEAYTLDLSYSGVCIVVDKNVPTNSPLWLTISLSPVKSIYLKGNIIWTKHLEDQKMLGIRFEYISDPDRDLIYEHAFEINKGEMIKKWYSGWSFLHQKDKENSSNIST